MSALRKTWELVVLDYKTDKIWSEQKLLDKYQSQLEYYARGAFGADYRKESMGENHIFIYYAERAYVEVKCMNRR